SSGLSQIGTRRDGVREQSQSQRQSASAETADTSGNPTIRTATKSIRTIMGRDSTACYPHMGRPFGDRGLRESRRTARGEAQESEGSDRPQSGPDGAAASDQPLDTKPTRGRQSEHDPAHARSPLSGAEVRAGRPLRPAERQRRRSAASTLVPPASWSPTAPTTFTSWSGR